MSCSNLLQREILLQNLSQINLKTKGSCESELSPLTQIEVHTIMAFLRLAAPLFLLDFLHHMPYTTVLDAFIQDIAIKLKREL